jgi:hypothetical protein
MLGEGKKTLILSLLSSSAASSSSSSPHLGFFLLALVSMADAGGLQLNIGALVEKRGRGRPHGTKNKSKDPAAVASSSASVKRRPGRPLGSKNKIKISASASGPSAPPRNASPPPSPRIYSFFCIADAQCREIQRVPLKFTKFMDGRELQEAVLCEHSGGGTPYEVEVWYDGDGEMYFKGLQKTMTSIKVSS